MKRNLTEQEEQAIRLVHHDFVGLSRKEAALRMNISVQRLSSIFKSAKIKAPQLFPILTQEQNKVYQAIYSMGNDRQTIADRLDWSIYKVDEIIKQLRKKGVSLTVPKTVRYKPHMDNQIKQTF